MTTKTPTHRTLDAKALWFAREAERIATLGARALVVAIEDGETRASLTVSPAMVDGPHGCSNCGGHGLVGVYGYTACVMVGPPGQPRALALIETPLPPEAASLEKAGP